MLGIAILLVFASSFSGIFCQNDTGARVDQLEATVNALARQMMLQQMFVEETIRSDGCSGVKQVRHNKDGTRRYFSETHTLNSIAAIHDHSNNIRVVGMGEFVAVLNGVEFRTRHNDYKLNMPSTSTKEYHATEPIPYPEVPQSVSNKTTIGEQIDEMREYFRAWSLQSTKIRDYRPYFKPALCYLEGAWTTETESLDEPFDSDRHHIDATSWFDLHKKVLFTSMTGLKSNGENYAFLPTSIFNVTDGIPQFAQWNYRILCHPIKKRIFLNRLKVVDDLAARMAREDTLEDLKSTRAARFRVNGPNEPYVKETKYFKGLLDDIMYEIPGKDNYKGRISETSFGLEALRPEKDVPLNAARYHRVFRISEAGAMGLTSRHRGFKDESLFVALNTQPKVAPFSVTECKRKNCTTYESRLSYAIPLEIVMMTPLYKWNPYNIQYKEDDQANTVTADGRNGGLEFNTAWNGTHKKIYYQTPVEFFQGSEVASDPADTVKGEAGVLDSTGSLRRVVSSGTRIILPNISGIGALRTRYPIMPIYGECTSVWKELDAAKEILMKQRTYSGMMYETQVDGVGLEESAAGEVGSAHLEIQNTIKDPPGQHKHDVYVSRLGLLSLSGNKTMMAWSTENLGHKHEIEIAYNATSGGYYIKTCDKNPRCWDGHPRKLKYNNSN